MNEPSQADWRPHRVAETALLEDLGSESRQRTNLALMIAGGATLLPLTCAGALPYATGSPPVWAAWLAAGGLCAFVFAAIRRGRDAQKSRVRSAALLAEFGDAPGWLTEITLYQGKATSGRDAGLLWFEEGRMLFVGARSSFAMTPADIEPRLDPGYDLFDGWAHAALCLRYSSPVGPVRIGLLFLKDDRRALAFDHSVPAFRKSFSEWVRFGGSERGQMPPLRKGPDLPSLASLRRRSGVAHAVMAGMFVAGVGVMLPVGWVLTTFSVLALIALVFSLAIWPDLAMPHRCHKAVRDRQKLDALAREAR